MSCTASIFLAFCFEGEKCHFQWDKIQEDNHVAKKIILLPFA